MNLTYETLWIGRGSGLLISMPEKLNLVWFDWSNNCGAIDVKMDVFFMVLKFCLSSKLVWGIVYIAKFVSKKTGALILSMKFFILLGLLFIPIYLPWGLPWNNFVRGGASSCCFDMLDKLKKRVCVTIMVWLISWTHHS